MNTIAKTTAGGALASLQGLKSGLQNVQQALPATMQGMLLRMGTDGIWVFGPENIEVEKGSVWAVNPLSIKHGYTCWTQYDAKSRKKNELLGERMVPMTSPKPDAASLPQYDNGTGGNWDWKDQVSFDLICLNGEDKDEQVVYKTSSVGGINAVNELIGRVMAQLDTDPGNPVPCVKLENDSYTHKSYGKTYVPIFVVHQWAPLGDDMPEVEDEDETEQQAEPTKMEPAPEPARRRRSGAGEAPAQQAAQPTAPAEAAPTEQPRRRRRMAG